MSFRKKRVIRSTPLFMILYFIFLKYLFLLFGGIDDLYSLVLAIILALFEIVPMLCEEKKSTIGGRIASTINGLWKWSFLFLVMDTVVIYVLKSFVNLSYEHILIILAIVPVLGIYNFYHSHKLIVKEKVIRLDHIKEDVNIVHFSDVHFGSIRHRKIISQIANKLNDLSDVCDIAIISGDLADGSSCVDEDDFLAFKDVNMPIIFTAGNHDFYPGIDNVYKAAKKAGLIILDNDCIEFKSLNIFGVTFSFGDIEEVSYNKLKDSIKEDSGNIIVYHVPSRWEEFSKIGFDIQLSGHTHGGQFYPATWFCKLIFGYNMGLFKNNFGTLKDHYLHVTTGVGSMDYPMRWGTDSELVILKLRKNK